MNGYRTETLFAGSTLLLRLGVGEGAVRNRDVVADVGEFHRRPMTLRAHRGPAVHLQTSRCRWVAQEGERQLPILAGIFCASDHDAAVGARQDLGLAVEVRGTRQQRPERSPAQRPGGFLADLIIDEAELRPVSDEQEVAAAIFETNPAR